MKKFITLLLLCLTGMTAWAADIENVALKTDAGSYLAGTSDAIAMSTTAQRFTLKPVEGGTGAHQLLNTDLACWVNSGSNGYLSYAPQSQMNNARYFYFYEVLSTSTTTSLTAILSTTPKVGKKYVIVVKNENGGTTSGFYAIYGQWASGKTNRLDVVKKLSDTAPTMVSLSTSNESSTGAIDLAKVVWTLEVPTKECPKCGETVPEDCAVCPKCGEILLSSAPVTGTDDSVFTEGWYQIQIGSGNSLQHPDYKGYYFAGYPRTVNGNNWCVGLVEDGNDLNSYVYVSGSHNAFNIQFRKGGSGNIAQYYAANNCIYASSAPSSLYFIPNAEGTEWRIQGGGVQNWVGWNLGGPAVGSTRDASYANNYFKFTRVYKLPMAVAPEVGKSYKIAILKSDGTKTFIGGTGVTSSVADAYVLTVENSGDAEYPFTLVTADGKYLTSHGVQTTATKGNKTMFKGGTLGSANSQYVTCSQIIKDATYYLTAKERWVNTSKGNIILQESNNTFNNSDSPYMNGTFSSALIFEEVEMETYTVHISDNAPDAKVTYDGKEYANGDTFKAADLQESELSATDVEGLDYSIAISGTDVNVTYAAPLIDVTKTYYMLSYDAPTDMYLCMTSTTGNVVLSTTQKSIIQFEKISTGVYAIKSEGKYVGVSSWNAVPATTPFAWTVAKTEDDIFTFYQNTAGTYTGYLGTDDAKLLTAEAKLYNNKGTADPHQFILVEAGTMIDVTYTFTVDGKTIGTMVIEEAQGGPSTVASVLPDYVQATNAPAVVEEDNYTIETSYTGLPFEVGTKQYYINEWAQNTRNYLLYSNGTNVKEIKQDCNTSDFDVNVRAEGTDTEAYLWTVGGDWLNGFTFKSADGYYMQSPSKNPSNSDVVKVTKTLDTNCYFEPFVQATSGKFSWRPMGGTNNFAHTSDTGLTMGFYNGYAGANLEATTFTFIEYVPADLEITIGATGFATFYDEVDRIIPDGVTAYYCTEDDHKLNAVEITDGVIPANVGVVIEGATDTYTFVASNEEAEDIEESCLDGVTEDYGTQVLIDMYELYYEVTPTIYVFSKKDDVLGFYKYVGTTLGAHKAFYMTVPEAGVNGFILDFEGTEGVNSVINATNLKAGYDIQGRKLNKIQKGINILNGKKIIK